jgi:hypothetical protein
MNQSICNQPKLAACFTSYNCTRFTTVKFYQQDQCIKNASNEKRWRILARIKRSAWPRCGHILYPAVSFLPCHPDYLEQHYTIRSTQNVFPNHRACSKNQSRNGSLAVATRKRWHTHTHIFCGCGQRVTARTGNSVDPGFYPRSLYRASGFGRRAYGTSCAHCKP